MPKGSIRLHPQHGLNPTIPVCFWCGEDTGEVALLGDAYRGEAPHRMIIGQNPCPACKEKMALGITFTEATGHPPQYTGRWCVVKEEAVQHMINKPAMLADILRLRRVNVEPAVFDMLMAQLNAPTD
jgi:hypothetical protein